MNFKNKLKAFGYMVLITTCLIGCEKSSVAKTESSIEVAERSTVEVVEDSISESDTAIKEIENEVSEIKSNLLKLKAHDKVIDVSKWKEKDTVVDILDELDSICDTQQYMVMYGNMEDNYVYPGKGEYPEDPRYDIEKGLAVFNTLKFGSYIDIIEYVNDSALEARLEYDEDRIDKKIWTIGLGDDTFKLESGKKIDREILKEFKFTECKSNVPGTESFETEIDSVNIVVNFIKDSNDAYELIYTF